MYIYIWIVRYVTFKDRLRLGQCHKVVTSHIAVSSSYTKISFISLSLVHDIGKKSYKIHSGIEKTTPRFLS